MVAHQAGCCCKTTIGLCCACDDAPQQWIADLGAGGWIDGTCCSDSCEQVAGEFTLDYLGLFLGGSCEWRYKQEVCIWPGLAGGLICQGCEDDALVFEITLFLREVAAGKCRYFVNVNISNPFAPVPPRSCNFRQIRAGYQIVDFPNAIDCHDDTPLTLHRIFHDADDLVCKGVLVDSITIRPA